MGRIRWYKRDPDAALNGMAVLTLEECGAYNRVLDLIYSFEGNLRDDDAEMSRLVRCDVRVWKRIRKRLVDLEKLYVHGGNLHNPRADDEIDAALLRVQVAADAGRTSQAKQAERRKLIKDLGLTPVERPFQLSTPTKKITTTESGSARLSDEALAENPSVARMRERVSRAKPRNAVVGRGGR